MIFCIGDEIERVLDLRMEVFTPIHPSNFEDENIEEFLQWLTSSFFWRVS